MLAFYWLVAASLLLFAYCLSTLFRREGEGGAPALAACHRAAAWLPALAACISGALRLHLSLARRERGAGSAAACAGPVLTGARFPHGVRCVQQSPGGGRRGGSAVRPGDDAGVRSRRCWGMPCFECRVPCFACPSEH